MQFKDAQRAEIEAHWNESSWFYRNLGQPARDIISRAYGLLECSPRQRALSQEVLTTVMSIFARRIGADKSHVVHALLTGSVDSLGAALIRREADLDKGRKGPNAPIDYAVDFDRLKSEWEASFREIIIGSI